MTGDTLGDRIKRYEAVANPLLTPKTPIVIRVDGRAFHTWTRGADRPFDHSIIRVMVEAARFASEQMQGFKVGYVQSDEATFVLTDTDTHQTQQWFGGELNKIVSITASAFTAHFNRFTFHHTSESAMFDARAFNVPLHDAPNALIWRQQDWHRNSLQMLARSHFSHKELNGKKAPDIHEMLHSVGVNWAACVDYVKNGTFIFPHFEQPSHEVLDYTRLLDVIEDRLP